MKEDLASTGLGVDIVTRVTKKKKHIIRKWKIGEKVDEIINKVIKEKNKNSKSKNN